MRCERHLSGRRFFALICLFISSAIAIKQIVPSHVAVGQIYPAVLTSLTPAGNGWHARLACNVVAIVPRPYGSAGPVQGEAVSVRVLGINAANGSVVGTLVQGKTSTSIA